MKYIFIILMASLVLSCHVQQQRHETQHRLPFYNSADFDPQWIDDTAAAYKSIHTIPSFSFMDQNGEIVTDKKFSNKIYVADFFFTSCPGICKKLTTNLALVQHEFLTDTNLLILSHSVTPETDNVAKLRQYATNFGAINHKWFLVTGERNKIYSIARNAYFADEDLGQKKSTNDFLHTENVLLIDKHKRIRGVYKGTSELQIKNLMDDIKILELE
jgi:protein SCO1/2